MHPRNIYNQPIDFKDMSQRFPEFAKVTQMDISGNIKIDLKNQETARVFTRCCLKKDFNLDVELPPNKLLPTIPLRLNYIYWIEDLLKYYGLEENITGVDIGCGASCIYCLLSVRMNNAWKMFALEIDADNIKFGQENISRNQLNGSVTLIDQKKNLSIFEEVFKHDPRPKSFCMCNPPFYNSSNEVYNSQNRTGKRKSPKSLNSGSSCEIIFEEGGELGFVKRILNESIQLGDKIQIYSTMFGCKKNVKKFIEELKTQNIQSYTTTEFVQGKTTRWGVGWSFKYDLKSFKDHSETLKKSSTSVNILKYEIHSLDLSQTVAYLKQMFLDLKIVTKIIEETSGYCYRWELIATENTWSNQRRRRRAELRQEITTTSKGLVMNTDTKDLRLGLELKKSKEVVQLQMFFISGNMSRDCTNQILQFIKNKLK